MLATKLLNDPSDLFVLLEHLTHTITSGHVLTLSQASPMSAALEGVTWMGLQQIPGSCWRTGSQYRSRAYYSIRRVRDR